MDQVDKKLMGNLLDLQLWNIGKDILYRTGNLMIKIGCSKDHDKVQAPPETYKRYSIQLDNNTILKIWGWGVLVYDINSSTGVYVNRFNFEPKIYDNFDPHRPIENEGVLGRGRPPKGVDEFNYVLTRLLQLSSWMTEYEKWIDENTTDDWRGECLQSRFDNGLPDIGIATDAILPCWESFSEFLTAKIQNDGTQGSISLF